MRYAFDMSSVIWSCLLVGEDKEGTKVIHNDKPFTVNTAMYGYEFAINHIISSLRNAKATPKDMIMVFEGYNSKANRLTINKDYKSKRGDRPLEAYAEFNTLKGLLQSAFSKLGALSLTQEQAEADDSLAWLAENSEDDLVISTNDNDLSVLNGVNSHGATVTVVVKGAVGENKYGDWPCKYITLYKSMVGDTTDTIVGIKGFGLGAWQEFMTEFGVAGLEELDRLARLGSFDELVPEMDQSKMISRLVNGRVDFFNSWQLAKLHPEWVNTFDFPVQLVPGLIKGSTGDERLAHWEAKEYLVTSQNYAKYLEFLKSHLDETPFFSVDLETYVDEDSEDWLLQRNSSGKGVDVIGSMITGGSISFGANLQYALYISVNHTDTSNVTLEQFGGMLLALDTTKLTVAHNAAGFELPVLFNHFGGPWKDNGWRGMFPNMVDSRIAASFWNENTPSHGLKQLGKLLFNYDQVSYAEVTKGMRMNEIPAIGVVAYGCDDVFVASSLWNFFALTMQLEHSYGAFFEYEQKPMYLQALAYCQGLKIDMAKLAELSQADAVKEIELQHTIDTFLIEKGWEGTVLPVHTEITSINIKEVVELCGSELKTMVRTISKLAPLIKDLGFDGCGLLASIVETNSVEAFNQFISQRWVARPSLNTGSPLQLKDLLYNTMGAPIRLRNRPTDVMRARGIKEGSARTDDEAMNMAIKQGDVVGTTAEVLKALIEVKSINTRKGLYWTAYPKFLHPRTGRIHPEFRQSSTNTRRYTGGSPNLQQMESSYGGVRSVIIPHHKNAVVASLDESAQEVRQMCDYSRDDNLLMCYVGTKEQLRDVHSIVACKIAGCPYEEFRLRLKDPNKEVSDLANAQRQIAKITLFATLYGAMAAKIAEGLGITQEEAQGYIDAIYERFPKVKLWKEEVEGFAITNGYVKIHKGTIRHLAELIKSDDRYVASKALRQAGNASIQSAGGNQIKRIMGRIWDSRLLDDYDYRWYFSVHDETVHSIGKGDAVEVLRQLHGFMTEQFLEIVPSVSSLGLGKSFGELNEIGEVFDPEKIQKYLT